jgi:hypothetical protein
MPEIEALDNKSVSTTTAFNNSSPPVKYPTRNKCARGSARNVLDSTNALADLKKKLATTQDTHGSGHFGIFAIPETIVLKTTLGILENSTGY